MSRQLTRTVVAAAVATGLSLPAAADSTIDWWGWAPAIETAQEYIAAFNEEHPDIAVNFRSIPYANYVQALRLGLVSSAGPDVFNLEPGVITAQFGQFAQDIESTVEQALGDDWRDQLSQAGVADFTTDGTLLAVPIQIGAAGQLWYNHDMQQAIGFEIPETLEQWQSACQTIEAADKICFVHGGKDDWVNLDAYIGIAQSVAPGKVIDAIEGRTAFTDPDLIEAFSIWKSLFDDGIMQAGALGMAQYPDARNAFVGGEAAFILMGTWHANNMGESTLAQTQQSAGQDPAPFTQLAIGLPDMAGRGNPSMLYGGADYGLAISKRSDDAEAAATFVQWLGASEPGAGMVAANTFPPALTRVGFQVPDFVDEALQAPVAQAISQGLAEITAPRQIPYPDVKQALADALSAVAAGTRTPDEAAADVENVSAASDR